MNKTVSEAKDFALQTAELVKFAEEHNVLVGVAPTYLCLDAVKNNVSGMIVAAQNCHFEDSGAFTGEVSIPMLKDLGISWCLIGHSERRTYDNETNEKCNKKIVKLVKNDMVPAQVLHTRVLSSCLGSLATLTLSSSGCSASRALSLCHSPSHRWVL